MDENINRVRTRKLKKLGKADSEENEDEEIIKKENFR